jgi:hypothetical protein
MTTRTEIVIRQVLAEREPQWSPERVNETADHIARSLPIEPMPAGVRATLRAIQAICEEELRGQPT